MLISTRGRYALRVLVDIAEHQEAGSLPLKEIAERQDISEKYLENIVRELVRAGILIGARGKGGGYRLSRAPEEIPVLSVLEAAEGTLAPIACLEGDAPGCPRSGDCRTLPLWEGLNAVIRDYLRGCTLAELMRKEPPASGGKTE